MLCYVYTRTAVVSPVTLALAALSCICSKIELWCRRLSSQIFGPSRVYDRIKMATCDECCGFNLKDVETYVKKHDIHYILKDCIIKLCSSRPDNPYRFMREYFENLEKVWSDCTGVILITSSGPNGTQRSSLEMEQTTGKLCQKLL